MIIVFILQIIFYAFNFFGHFFFCFLFQSIIHAIYQ